MSRNAPRRPFSYSNVELCAEQTLNRLHGGCDLWHGWGMNGAKHPRNGKSPSSKFSTFFLWRYHETDAEARNDRCCRRLCWCRRCSKRIHLASYRRQDQPKPVRPVEQARNGHRQCLRWRQIERERQEHHPKPVGPAEQARHANRQRGERWQVERDCDQHQPKPIRSVERPEDEHRQRQVTLAADEGRTGPQAPCVFERKGTRTQP